MAVTLISPVTKILRGVTTCLATLAKATINRLIDGEIWGGKIPAVCENVKKRKIYDQFTEQKGTQLIFCDTGLVGEREI